jgi:SSS family solute:Na+ symporter
MNAAGGLAAIIGGFAVGVALKCLGAWVAMPPWFYPFANQAAITWTASLIFCIVGSALYRGPVHPPLNERVTVWDSAALLREGLGEVWYKSVVLWSFGFVTAILGAMLIFSDWVFPSAVP